VGDRRGYGLRPDLQPVDPAGEHRLVAHPYDRRLELIGHPGGSICGGDDVPAADVDLVGQRQRDRLPRDRVGEIAPIRDEARHAAFPPRRLHADAVIRPNGPARHDPGEAPEVGVRPVDPLDGHAEGGLLQPRVIDLDRLEMAQQGWPVVPGGLVAEGEDVVTLERGHRDAADAVQADLRGEGAVRVLDRRERRAGVADEVHLVDGEHNVADPEQRHQVTVPSRLGQDALACVDEKDRGIGGGGARHHVAGVLFVTGRVGDDEAAPVGGEESVRNVDRDALLPLGDQTVQEECEVEVAALRAHLPRVRLQGRQLIFQQQVGVVEQATDQRALAVVDAAARDEAKQPVTLLGLQVVLDGHQK
jgi:hypothetical protein